MVATITDLSRRGDGGPFALPLAFAQADGLLRTWMQAVNAQNTSQELSILTGPGETPGFCGWTIKARLALLNLGQPVELMSQWVANLTTGAVTVHGALASGFTAGSALGGHGTPHGRGGHDQLIDHPAAAAAAAWELWWRAAWRRIRSISPSPSRSTTSATARRWRG